MKQHYKSISFRSDTLEMIDVLNETIERYVAQGYTLSVRQLYYQLVAADLIENTERSYKRIASIINDGRLAGLIDWDAIEDRNRDVVMKARWESGAQIVEAAANSYHMDMWANQRERVFVIVEKAALAGILEPLCRRFDVPLLAARGYPSVSVIRELVEEQFLPAAELGSSQAIRVLHLGDHDPSGLDMTRDLKDRMALFMGSFARYVTVERIALNMEQIDDLQPPPNPAKTTDARFAGYRKKFGEQSWELDALQPEYIENLVTRHIKQWVEWGEWNDRTTEIEAVRKKLTAIARKFETEGN